VCSAIRFDYCALCVMRSMCILVVNSASLKCCCYSKLQHLKMNRANVKSVPLKSLAISTHPSFVARPVAALGAQGIFAECIRVKCFPFTEPSTFVRMKRSFWAQCNYFVNITETLLSKMENSNQK
jgi:hypothetical protein